MVSDVDGVKQAVVVEVPNIGGKNAISVFVSCKALFKGNLEMKTCILKALCSKINVEKDLKGLYLIDKFKLLPSSGKLDKQYLIQKYVKDGFY